MSIRKKEFIEYEIGLEEVRAGLKWLSMYGKKSFKDHTGEWVEVRCAGQPNFFDVNIEPIAHEVEEVL
jgi:hypothetical protein